MEKIVTGACNVIGYLGHAGISMDSSENDEHRSTYAAVTDTWVVRCTVLEGAYNSYLARLQPYV